MTCPIFCLIYILGKTVLPVKNYLYVLLPKIKMLPKTKNIYNSENIKYYTYS